LFDDLPQGTEIGEEERDGRATGRSPESHAGPAGERRHLRHKGSVEQVKKSEEPVGRKTKESRGILFDRPWRGKSRLQEVDADEKAECGHLEERREAEEIAAGQLRRQALRTQYRTKNECAAGEHG